MSETPEAPRWAFLSFAVGILGFWYLTSRSSHKKAPSNNSAVTTDPSILKKGTTYESFTTPSGYVYPRIRTFFHAHPKSGKVPDNLPLLVFVHGLGGSAAQFAPLMTSLVNIAPCLTIDLPGCGLSAFNPKTVAQYTIPAFAELVYCAIDRFRDKINGQSVVLIAHSMGCSISSLLVSSTSPLAHLCSKHIAGIIAICPRSSALSAHEITAMKRLGWVPSWLFDLVRLADRRGGVDSASVFRVVGPEADLETRKLQLRFNEQSKTSVFRKFIQGLYLLETGMAAKGQESLLGERIWSGIRSPLFLVAAENDKLASPQNVEQITTWLTRSSAPGSDTAAGSAPKTTDDAAKVEDPKTQLKVSSNAGIAPQVDAETTAEAGTEPMRPESIPGEAADTSSLAQAEASRYAGNAHLIANVVLESKAAQRTKNASMAIKTSIFPAPASHGLLYATANVRILAGLIETFLAKYVDERLAPGWQQQHLATRGKWDVKNLQKWQAVAPCSEPIAGVFRALKTMREVDETHCPRVFVQQHSCRPTMPDGVAMVVDLSHETPVYDQAGLEAGGVQYHKFPTVSKLPPSADEVRGFVALVDELRASPHMLRAADAYGSGTAQPTIGVHCHYGFNRTGFFIICYLVERLGWQLQSAIDEFALKRPPGIKHEYFVNELFVRYAVKMERRGTVIA